MPDAQFQPPPPDEASLSPTQPHSVAGGLPPQESLNNYFPFSLPNSPETRESDEIFMSDEETDAICTRVS